MPALAPLLVNGVPWSSEGPRRNSHTFNCRMLVNPHSESQDEPHEHEPQQQQKYETMQCFAVSEPKSIKEEGDGMQGEKNTHNKVMPSDTSPGPVICVENSYKAQFE